MITRLKRFGRIDLKCNHNHWPGSSACPSYLPRPGLLQRVSIYQAKILKVENWRLKNPSYWKLPLRLIQKHCEFSDIFQYFAKVQQRLHTTRRQLWEGCQWLPITPWGPKEWYWCYFPSVFNHVFMVGHANTKRMSHMGPVIELQVEYKLLKFQRDNIRVPSRYH